MSREDQLRWDEKWTKISGNRFQPNNLLKSHRHLLSKGDALDLACGRGQNSIWLAQIGYQVLGVDISPIALEKANIEAERQGANERTRFMIADLDQWIIPEKAFDLICVFRFLDRRLFSAISRGLREGGLLFYSTRYQGSLKQAPDENTQFLLQPGELAATFANWIILHDWEDDRKAYFVAKKPSNND